MTEIVLTQGKVAIVDDDDYEFLSQWKWRATKSGKVWYVLLNSKVLSMTVVNGKATLA